MFVPSWQVYPFNFIKKPFVSGLWYTILVYLIFNPITFLSTALAILFLLFSFTPYRFHLAMFSPIPCIISIVLSWIKLVSPYPFFVTIAGIVWLVMYFIAIFIVNARLNLGQYVISPVTNRMMYDAQYYMMKGLRK